MALPHARPGDVVDVRPLGAALASTRSYALFKSDQLEVARIVLPAGEQIPPHAVAGEITVQCIEGRIAFTSDAGERELTAGQLSHITGAETYALRSIEDASLLLTIVLKPDPHKGVKR